MRNVIRFIEILLLPVLYVILTYIGWIFVKLLESIGYYCFDLTKTPVIHSYSVLYLIAGVLFVFILVEICLIFKPVYKAFVLANNHFIDKCLEYFKKK